MSLGRRLGEKTRLYTRRGKKTYEVDFNAVSRAINKEQNRTEIR